jgi:large subunit ribosomal protein L23
MSQKIRHDQIRSVIISPHISEKTTGLSEKNQQITFKVRFDSNKTQIKKAVENFLMSRFLQLKHFQ